MADIENRGRKEGLSEEDLYRLAMIDELTGVYNRRAFLTSLYECIGSAKKDGSSVTLLVTDVDKFKSINDTYGHQTGDKAIVEVARMLQEGVRDNDIVGRYGGDEFVIILTDADEDAALVVSERLRLSVSESRFMSHDEKHEIQMTLSIGMATFPKDAQDSKTLFKQSDRALYASKEGGRNRVARISDVSDVLDMEENLEDKISNPMLVGREKELSTLMSVYEDSVRGEKGFCLITSKKGIGKTKLLDSLFEKVKESQNVFLCRMSLHEGESQRPYKLIVDLFSVMFKHRKGAEFEAVKEAYLKLDEETQVILAEYIAEFKHLMNEGFCGEISKEDMRSGLLKGLCQLFINISVAKTLIFAFDGISEIDEGTQQVIQSLFVSKGHMPLLVVVAALPEIKSKLADKYSLSTFVKHVGKAVVVCRIELEAFSIETTRDLIRDIFDSKLSDEGFAKNVFESCGGVPRRIVDLIKQLKESEAISCRSGKWNLDNVDEKYFRQTHEEIVGEMIKGLDPEIISTLVDAAGIGTNFTVDNLVALTMKNRGLVLGILDVAIRANILTVINEDEGEYGFVSAAVKDLIWEQVDLPYRRLLNKKLAELVEEEYAGKLDDVADELAFRYDAAEMSQKAQEYASRASKRAEMLFSQEEVMRYYGDMIAELEAGILKRELQISEEHMLIIVNFLKRIRAVVTNVGIYPEGHIMRVQSVKDTFASCEEILRLYSSLSFSEAIGQAAALSALKNNLLVNGQVLTGKRADINLVTESLLELLNGNHIDSFKINKGLKLNELEKFLYLLYAGWETHQEHGGLSNVMKKSGIQHIEVNDVHYRRVLSEEDEAERRILIKDMVSSEYLVDEILDEMASIGERLFSEINTDPKKVAEYLTNNAADLKGLLNESRTSKFTDLTVDALAKGNDTTDYHSLYRILFMVSHINALEPEKLQNIIRHVEALKNNINSPEVIQEIDKRLADFHDVILKRDNEIISLKQNIISRIIRLPKNYNGSDEDLKALESKIDMINKDAKGEESNAGFALKVIDGLSGIRGQYLTLSDNKNDFGQEIDEIVVLAAPICSSIDIKHVLMVLIDDITEKLQSSTDNTNIDVFTDLQELKAEAEGKILSDKKGQSAAPVVLRGDFESLVLSDSEEAIALWMLSVLPEQTLLELFLQVARKFEGNMLGLRKLIKKIRLRDPANKEPFKNLVSRFKDIGLSNITANFVIHPEVWEDYTLAQKLNDINSAEPEFCCFIGLKEYLFPLIEEDLVNKDQNVASQISRKLFQVLDGSAVNAKKYFLSEVHNLINVLKAKNSDGLLINFITRLILGFKEERNKDVLDKYREIMLKLLIDALEANDFKNVIFIQNTINKDSDKKARFKEDVTLLYNEFVNQIKFQSVIDEFIKGSLGHEYEDSFQIISCLEDAVTPVVIRILKIEGLAKGRSYEEFAVFYNLGEIVNLLDDENAVKQIQELLLDSRWFVVVNAIHLISVIKKGDFANTLIYPMKHEDNRVRMEVAVVLGEIGGDVAIDVLELVLEDDDKTVKKLAVQSLAKIGTKEVIPVLDRALDKKGMGREIADDIKALKKNLGK